MTTTTATAEDVLRARALQPPVDNTAAIEQDARDQEQAARDAAMERYRNHCEQTALSLEVNDFYGGELMTRDVIAGTEMEVELAVWPVKVPWSSLLWFSPTQREVLTEAKIEGTGSYAWCVALGPDSSVEQINDVINALYTIERNA